jgi:hypothetical protein
VTRSGSGASTGATAARVESEGEHASMPGPVRKTATSSTPAAAPRFGANYVPSAGWSSHVTWTPGYFF